MDNPSIGGDWGGLGAILKGEVAVLIAFSQPLREKTVTMESADCPYRVFVEAIHKGA